MDRSQLLNGEWLLSVEAALSSTTRTVRGLNPVGMVTLVVGGTCKSASLLKNVLFIEPDEPTVQQENVKRMAF